MVSFGLRSCTLLLGLRSSWFEVLYFAKTFNSFETEKQDGRCKVVYAPIGISSFVFESTWHLKSKRWTVVLLVLRWHLELTQLTFTPNLNWIATIRTVTLNCLVHFPTKLTKKDTVTQWRYVWSKKTALRRKTSQFLCCSASFLATVIQWNGHRILKEIHVWNSKEIVLKKVSTDQDSEMYHNFTGEYLHQVTCKFWILISPRQLTMLEDMAKLLLNQNDCDVYFHFDNGKKIGAHINILKLRSPIFASMFQHEMEEKKTGRVHIQDIDSDIFPTITVFLVLRLDQHAFDVRNGKSTLRCSRQIRG